MVARASDATTIHARVTQADQRQAELTRAVGRGGQALRDTENNVLIMAPGSSVPSLQSTDHDVGLTFRNGVLAITDASTEGFRTLNAGGGHYESNVGCEGQMTAGTMGTNVLGVGTANCGKIAIPGTAIAIDGGGMNAGPHIFADHFTINGTAVGADSGGMNAGPNVSAGQVSCGGTAFSATVSCSGLGTFNDVGSNHIGVGTCNAGNLSYVALVPPPSERGLKTDVDPIAHGLDVVNRLDPIRYRYTDPPTVGGDIEHEPDNPLRAGVFVDEIAEHAPELVIEHQNADGPTGHRTYDDRGLTAYLVSAVQELSDKVDALQKRVDELETAPPAIA